MKSILLHANDDLWFESRLTAALDLTAKLDAKLSCVQVTPYESFIMGDPFGGVYALPTVVEHLGEEEETHRRKTETRLKKSQVKWEWLHYEGHPGHVLLERSRLADLIVVSLPGEDEAVRRLSLPADLAIHARAPVLAVPGAGEAFRADGVATIAWNGSAECAHALRFAVPLLSMARTAHLITVTGEHSAITATQAAAYLADHGVAAQLHERPRDGRHIADLLFEAASELGAAWLVAGAYGHSRIREAVLGGTTRELIARSSIPLVLAH